MNARAITLHQPWASLVAVGAKTLLDQAKPTEWRGPLLIRAAQSGYQRQYDWSDEVAAAVAEMPNTGVANRYLDGRLPLGAVVASCVLADCVETKSLEWRDFTIREDRGSWLRVGDSILVDRRAEPFGDFSPGRYAWLLEDVKATSERCPRCWGDGRAPCEPFACPCHEPEWCADEPSVGCDLCRAWHGDLKCPTCAGTKTCPPVPMKGHQGIWTPTWETT